MIGVGSDQCCGHCILEFCLRKKKKTKKRAEHQKSANHFCKPCSEAQGLYRSTALSMNYTRRFLYLDLQLPNVQKNPLWLEAADVLAVSIQTTFLP